MANQFDNVFAAASPVFFETFGETGGVEYFATASASPVTWDEAIIDTGDIDGFELIDAAGERINEAATVTIDAATTWSLNGLVRIGGASGEKWHIVGEAVRSGSLITLALSRKNNTRMNRSRASARNR
jgi:aconitase B